MRWVVVVCGLKREIYVRGRAEGDGEAVAASGRGGQESPAETLHDATDFIPGILCEDVDCGAGVSMYCVAPIKRPHRGTKVRIAEILKEILKKVYQGNMVST